MPLSFKELNREDVHLRNDDPQRVYLSQNEETNSVSRCWRKYSYVRTVSRNKAFGRLATATAQVIVTVFLSVADPH